MKKKTLISFLASLGCLACLAGCGADTSGLEAAKDYIKELYKNEATETGADFERAGKITIKGVEYTIEWSVNTTEIAVTQDSNGNYVIDVDEAAEADVNYVLTAVITDPNGNKETLTYNYTMPKFREMTHAEYAATEEGKAVIVKGVITALVNTDSNRDVYFEDADGGYYIYNLDAETHATLQVGQEIRARGTRSVYNGNYQIKNATVEILNAEATPVTPNDITAIFEAAADVNATELTSLQSTLVTLKGVTVLGQDTGNNTYYNFILGDNQSYVRLSGSSCALSSADQELFKTAVADHIGYTADVVGIVTLYSGKFYLSPITKDAFSNFTIAQRSDAEMVEFEAGLMDGLAAKLTSSVDLQTTGTLYTDVAITWASNNETVAKVEGGKLVITRPAIGEADATVKITATLTAGTESTSVEYTVLVPAMPATLPQALASAPVVGTMYKFYLEQKNLNTNLYFKGGMDGYYLATSSNQEEAIDVYVEDAGDGKFYLATEGAYINVTVRETNDDGSPKNYSITCLDRDPVTKYTWDDENKALIAEEVGAFIGTYGTYQTFSPSKTSYIASGNFVARLCTLVPADEWVDIFAPVDSGKTPVLPEAGKAYAFGMAQGNLEGAVYYLKGGMDGHYMATTTKIEDAIATYLEATTGGYHFYTYVNDVKTYINMVVSGTYVNGAYEATASTVYTIDTEHKTLVADVNGVPYWFGTRNDKNYTTMGPCKVEYNGFYGEFYAVDAEEHVHEYTSVVTDPTCTVDGYTTHSCTCGDSYTDTVVTAPGHNFVDGACTVCTAPDPDAATHEHNYTPVVTDPTCTTDGYTTWTCACEDSYTDTVVPATGHADANADYKCDNNCGTVVVPEADSVLTIPQAKALATALGVGQYTTNKYYMTVTIESIYNTTYGNANVVDADGNKYVIYGLYTWDKATRYDAMDYKPTTGDEITVYGVVGSYNSTPQMKDAWIDEVVQHEHDYTAVPTDATCTADGKTTHTCSICDHSYVDNIVPALGHTTEEGTCERCGQEVGSNAFETVLPSNLTFASAANKASADTYMKDNYADWTITGKLGQTYGGYLGFGRSGDGTSAITSSAISVNSAFTVKTVLKGNGSNGVATSTLTFTLVDANGTVVATGRASGASTDAITPADGKDTTYDISFTFVEGKTWTDVANLKISFAKTTGNIGLKSLEFIQA